MQYCATFKQFQRKRQSGVNSFLNPFERTEILGNSVHDPLMLTLLWQTFVVKGRFPTSRAFLYADISDFLLSTWDQTKGVNRTAKLETSAAVQRVLQRFARFQFEQQQCSTLPAASSTVNSRCARLSVDPHWRASHCSALYWTVAFFRLLAQVPDFFRASLLS